MAIKEMMGFEAFPASGNYLTLAQLGKGLYYPNATAGTVKVDVANGRQRLGITGVGSPYIRFDAPTFFTLAELMTRKCYIGFRIQAVNEAAASSIAVIGFSFNAATPVYPLTLADFGAGLEAYVELCIDIPNKTVTTWVDGVKIRDVAIPDYSTTLTSANFYIGPTSGASTARLYTYNDFYFMVDTSDLDNGTTPSTRLGPIKVRSIVPDTVTLGDGWTNPSGGDPAAGLAVSGMDATHLTTPALKSSVTRTPAVIGFARPNNAWPIKAVSLRVYGYRDTGTVPTLVGKVVQGANETPEVTYSMNPSTPKSGAAVDSLGVFNNSLDGTPWSADKLDQLQVSLYTKIGD